MKSNQIDVVVRPIKNKNGEYIAYCKADLLAASYFVYFQDTILGSVALNNFCEMIRFHYEKRINFVIDNTRLVSFQDRALLDVLSGRSA